MKVVWGKDYEDWGWLAEAKKELYMKEKYRRVATMFHKFKAFGKRIKERCSDENSQVNNKGDYK